MFPLTQRGSRLWHIDRNGTSIFVKWVSHRTAVPTHTVSVYSVVGQTQYDLYQTYVKGQLLELPYFVAHAIATSTLELGDTISMLLSTYGGTSEAVPMPNIIYESLQ